MKTTKKQSASAGRMPALVRQVSKALKRTKGLMFWSIIIDEEDIEDRLIREIAEYNYTDREAVESVIEGILGSHEQTMKNAAQDQCYQATKAALASLPNDKIHP